MKIKDLQKQLSTLDSEMEVYGSVYIDRRPFDGEGTDMSGTEYVEMKESYLKTKKKKYIVLDSMNSDEVLVIEPDRYDFSDFQKENYLA